MTVKVKDYVLNLNANVIWTELLEGRSAVDALVSNPDIKLVCTTKFEKTEYGMTHRADLNVLVNLEQLQAAVDKAIKEAYEAGKQEGLDINY